MAKELSPEEKKALESALSEGLELQHLFDAEPTLKVTGKGTMRSEGIKPFEKLKKGGSHGKTMAD